VRLSRRLSSVAFVLTGIDFFDELASGLPSAGAPELTLALGASVAALTLAVFTVPQLFGLLVDPPLLLWAERRGRARMIALGIAGMGASLIGAGLARSAVEFALFFALYFPASGLACGFGEASLMDLDPARREERMAAWALSGTLGDLFAPLSIAGAVFLFGSYRAAWLGIGLGLFGIAAFVARAKLPDPHVDAHDEATGTLRSAFRNQALLLWVAGAALCGLLDETFTALVALLLAERFAGEPFAVPIALTVCTAGGLIGLVALPRLLARFSPHRLLALSCVGTVLTMGGLLRAGSVLSACCWMMMLGVLVAFQYPLAQAQAYRAAGPRSGLVAVLAAPLSVFELVSPITLGLLAERFGLVVALSCVLAQPLGLLAVLVLARRRDRHRERPGC